MGDSDLDTSRTAIRTYVPAYQRDEWDDHAEDLDMSRSEFVKTMVQAGRRTFDESSVSQGAGEISVPADENSTHGAESDRGDTDPGLSSLERRVLDALDDNEHLSWEELLEELTAGLEVRLEETLQELQANDRIRYSGRNGGYTLDE